MGYQFGVYFYFAMGQAAVFGISLFFTFQLLLLYFFLYPTKLRLGLVRKELKINKQTLTLTANTSIFSDGVDTSNPDRTPSFFPTSFSSGFQLI